jgi:hypothetical protein
MPRALFLSMSWKLFLIHVLAVIRLASDRDTEAFRMPKAKMATVIKPSTEPLRWKKSFLWLTLVVACFHLAYTSLKLPAAGLFIFGYAFGLVQLTNQPTVRRAFYFGLVTAYLCYAPQLLFMWSIFGPFAIVLWLVLAFWVGLFAAIVCGSAALGQNQNRVADPDCLDGHRILPERTLLLEIFVAECRVCASQSAIKSI